MNDLPVVISIHKTTPAEYLFMVYSSRPYHTYCTQIYSHAKTNFTAQNI